MTNGVDASPSLRCPALHFTPPQGWMNDPNGLVYFAGEYHLCYQYYPDDRVWGPMHWGHAVSSDLVHWQHRPVALAPDAQGMCFSGSAIVDWHDNSGLFGGEPGLLAFYTVHRETAGNPDDYVQEQCLAYSRDSGRSWQKYPGNPILPNPGLRDFRDPKVVWHAPSRRWVMALACGQVIRFYLSDDLLDWRLASEFGDGQGAHTEGPWECPDLFELPVEGAAEGEPATRWVLVVGVGAGEQDDFGSFTQYFVGHFDGERFHNENPADGVLMMDEGRDFYAVQTWSDVPDSDGRRLAIAWLNNWLYANRIPEAGWRGTMSFPRELSLEETGEGIRLRQAFAAELGAAGRLSPWLMANSADALTVGNNVLIEQGPSAGHGWLSLQMAPGTILELDLQQAGHMLLRITHDGSTLQLEHWREGRNGDPDFDRRFPHHLTRQLMAGTEIELEWLVDRGSLELLVDGGRYASTHLGVTDPCLQPVVVRLVAGSARLTDGRYHGVIDPLE
ncbi:glycoside hydrolase family 32 protein [Halomonas sp. M4R1S46]|uniref:glycoside hydrolase family 32 protein n=1 Tax=Halomonas sp. M4R1S46 TaxID=2982692 RepID=UPI0021E3773B|nr:glycoside hydrolase family 32 protein [Halomonas sp. M4R1S46]UYG06888.1 glycoside hydrolase family 32 protein [Halomonas sp. M4R1S46]